MKLLILDKDIEYLKRFQCYLDKISIKYQGTLEINPFNQLENVKQELQHNKKYQVILVASSFEPEIDDDFFSLIENIGFAYLSEENEIIDSRRTIFKYGKVSKLYTEICKIYEDVTNHDITPMPNQAVSKQEEEFISKNMEIITFLPVHGGAGSSTMAAACALWFAKEYDVLYINLEQRPSDSIFFSGEGKRGISDIMSSLSAKDAAKKKLIKEVLPIIQKSIQEDKKQKSDRRVSFIKGYETINDCKCMTERTIEEIFYCVRNGLKNFKYVIIDADFIVSPILDKIITSSDKLVFTSSGADISDVKLTGIQRYLAITGREHPNMPENFLILNQYYGTNDKLTSVQNMKLISKFPRYRLKDGMRVTSQLIIDNVLSQENVFTQLKFSRKPKQEGEKK